MHIKVFRRNRLVFSADDADLLLVEDSSGNPVSIAARAGLDNTFIVSTIDNGEVEFNRLLKNLGIDKMVVKTDVGISRRPEQQLPFVMRSQNNGQ